MSIRELTWEEAFAREGAFWKHDGNKQRAYALLTSGRISDKFFNGGRVIKNPALLTRAVGHLVHKPQLVAYLDGLRGPPPAYRVPSSQGEPSPAIHGPRIITGRVVGPPYGATTFAYELARHLGWEVACPVKKTCKNDREEEVVVPGEFSLDRSMDEFREGELVLLGEDTITSGKSVRAMRKEVGRVCPTAQILPFVMALCNRSGKSHVDDMEIVSLIAPDMSSWEEGKNPFTGGPELVPPLRPKGKNWEILTRAYD
jgi:orotate phosphoribosyltransferase